MVDEAGSLNLLQEEKEKSLDTFSSEWWKRLGQVFVQSVKDFFRDNGPQWAAAIAYFTLLSSFPLMLAILSIASFFVSQEWAIQQGIQFLGDFLPQGEEQVETIIVEAIEARGTVSILAIMALLWSGSRVFGVVTRALNIAYDVDEPYGFFKRTLIELIMLISVGLLFIVALASRTLLPIVIQAFDLLPLNDNAIFNVLINLIPAVLLLLAFFTIYRFVPRRSVSWKAALPGAILATVLFVVGRPVFTGYVNSFADYHLIYGSLAVLIILVFWIWLVSVFLLLGGELVAHIQDMLIEGKTAEEVEQKHELRSPYSTLERVKELLSQPGSVLNEAALENERSQNLEGSPRDRYDQYMEKHRLEPLPRVEQDEPAPGIPYLAGIGAVLLAGVTGVLLLVRAIRR